MDLVAFCEANSSLKFYPNAFPIDEQTDLGCVRISPTYRASKGGLATVEIQVMFRSNHPANAEQFAREFLNNVDKNTNFNIGETKVVLLEVKNPFPIYVGKDENDRYNYSNDAWLLIER